MSKKYYSDKRLVLFSLISDFGTVIFMSIAGGVIFYFFSSPGHSIADSIPMAVLVLVFGVAFFFVISGSPSREYDYKIEINEDKIIIINDNRITPYEAFYWKEVKSIKFSITKILRIYKQTGDFMQIRKIIAGYEKAIDDVVTMALAENPKIKIDAKSRRRLEKFINKQ